MHLAQGNNGINENLQHVKASVDLVKEKLKSKKEKFPYLKVK